ncbi:MAG: hypothetical protein EZS28_004750 [Streblomastix strix]|uniref:Uncharacterized protein n=1 Tax=Streblomastix strix TaxID=222440 RepID=A0A5J4WXB3_9EUKA|nr:MAG: hypothetical protein EZS28_004750 [Streblomastix strix]
MRPVIPSESENDNTLFMKYGSCYRQYYELPISYFRPTTDARVLSWLQNRHWISALTKTSLVANSESYTNQIEELTRSVQDYHKKKNSQLAKQQMMKNVQRTLGANAKGIAELLLKYQLFGRFL